MPSLCSLTIFPKFPTSFQRRTPFQQLSWRICTPQELYLCMAFPRRSVLIEAAFSPLSSGRPFKRRLVRQCCSVPLIAPQTSGQVERVNQILDDMIGACVISFGMKWEECLPYAEFSYNNSYQASLQAAPFEVLYGRKCRTPLNWSETGERQRTE